VTVAELFNRHVEQLGQEVGGSATAADLLSRRLDASLGPLTVLDLMVRVKILTRYLEKGDPVKPQQIDQLVERQIDHILFAHREAIRKELGLT
jgi:hypothetical protein